MDILYTAQIIISRVLSSSSFADSKAIGCYLNMPSGEVITDGIVQAILGSGKTFHYDTGTLRLMDELRPGKSLYVPRLTPTGMEMLKIYSTEDFLSMKGGLWGIREPELEYLGQKRISGTHLAEKFCVLHLR